MPEPAPDLITKIDSVGLAGQSSLAFVGQQGVGSTLQIEERPGQIRIQWGRSDYALTLSLLGLFGPGMLTLYGIRPSSVHLPGSGYFAFALPVFSVVLTVLFVGRLWAFFANRRVIEVVAAGISLMEGRRIVRTISTGQIQSLTIDIYQYLLSSSEHIQRKTIPNYILTARLTNGGFEALCVTSDQSQLDRVRTGVGRLLRLTPP